MKPPSLSSDKSNEHMKHLLSLAEGAGRLGEVPVAAMVIDKNGKIIAQKINQMKHNEDPTAHAEILALAAARTHLGQYYLQDCGLMVTLEPCPMCAHAIALSRIGALYYGAYDVKAGGVDHGARIFAQQGCNHIPEIIGGLCETEASEILQDFFEKARNNP